MVPHGDKLIQKVKMVLIVEITDATITLSAVLVTNPSVHGSSSGQLTVTDMNVHK